MLNASRFAFDPSLPTTFGACSLLPLWFISHQAGVVVTLKHDKLTSDFTKMLVPSLSDCLPAARFSCPPSCLRDLGVVVMPSRLPALTIQPFFSVVEPADAGVVGRDRCRGVLP